MIIPVFQPIRCFNTKKDVGAEVLCRWCGIGGLSSPGELDSQICWADVDLALISVLTIDALKSSRAYSRIMINVSEQTLASDEYFAAWMHRVRYFVERSTARVCIEITEQVTDQTLVRRWEWLISLGVSLVIDDYGYEYSTFERLKSFPWNACKFDIQRLTDDRDAITYCLMNDVRVIAEKVETSDQATLAAAAGLTWQQGFLFGKPEALREHSCSTNIKVVVGK